jgi:hypothetical protein
MVSTATFCEKPKRNTGTAPAATVQAVHQRVVKEICEKQSQVPEMERRLAELEASVRVLEERCHEDPNAVLQKSEVEREMRELQAEIARGRDRPPLDDYCARLLPILHEYFDEGSDQGQTVMDPPKDGGECERGVSETGDDAPKKGRGMQRFVNRKVNTRRLQLFDRYMSAVNAGYDPKAIGLESRGVEEPEECSWCGAVGTMEACASEGYSECTQCGMSQVLLIETDRRSFKDTPTDSGYYCYKRINHFRECLAQFQAKESTEIPQHVYDVLEEEVRKNRITDLRTLTDTRIRSFLKKHRLAKYYEHAPHLLYKLNGVPPPSITKEEEERLCNAFKEIQAPFAKVCPKNRVNFLSYSFCLYKIAELMDMDRILHCFPLLKSKEKRMVQDQIWKQICEILHWQYIPTPLNGP